MSDDLKLPPKQEEILRLLVEHGELYGLELVDRSGGALTRGTVYVTARRMEERGLVQSRQDPDPPPGAIGLPRRYFQATEAGKRLLEARATARRHFLGLPA